ncbi:MAG TPA: dihydroorotate dehydrogenase electron transfer subunit [Bacteroidales bacterium]|nr:dihydroorotate dehydrogenase electron transfer subunit [Bacteroidales bacterium]HPS27099.1 dihydroorotate dehydrogenase electron transfer subunit [Bacteroidales bacterium]
MKKYQKNLTVVSNTKLNSDYFVLGLSSSEPLPEILPGQFAEVLVENNPKVFLRRPISVHDVDYENNIVYLLVKIIGEGTRSLSLLQEGMQLDLVFPLGNSFSINDGGKVLLAGGGCGIAPMLYLARCLHKRNVKVSVLLGGRTASDILRTSEFEKYGDVFISTDDGSLGEKGFITKNSLLENIKDYDRLYCCGPEIMMKVLASIAKEKGVDCEVSLENTMACGIGACLCCVTKTIHGHQCVCTEGPVFNIKSLTWQI